MKGPYSTTVRFSLLMLSSIVFFFVQRALAAEKPVKVFILAGQSNMEGKGFPRPLAWQVSQPAYRERYQHLIQDSDYDAFVAALERSLSEDPKAPLYRWSSRSDVWVDFHDRHGDLSVGYSPNKDCFGPELNMGHVLGDSFDEPVCLIKTAWGGKALGRGFLPPSMRATPEDWERIAADEGKTTEEVKTTHGVFYDRMLEEIQQALKHMSERHPAYQNQGYAVEGFVWFQGWNDQFKDSYRDRYQLHLAALIQDIRRDLGHPQLPVIIGQLGHDGDKKGMYPLDAQGQFTAQAVIRKAQWDVAHQEDGISGVTCVRTAPFWDMEADGIYYGPGGWQKDVERWRQFGDDRPYHYLGSPWFFAQVGTSFGKAMLEMLSDSTSKSIPNSN